MLAVRGGEERGVMGALRQNKRVQETSLGAQETFWWDLKSGCCDVFVGLSPKTLAYPAAMAARAASLASGGAASAPSL